MTDIVSKNTHTELIDPQAQRVVDFLEQIGVLGIFPSKKT